MSTTAPLAQVHVHNFRDSRNSRIPVVNQGEMWEPPVPFTEYHLPAFPTTALPAWLRDYVLAEAETTQTPPDLAAMLTLAVCGAAVAKKVVVHVWEGWSEPTNIFVVVALPPGARKSAVFADIIQPLYEYERELAQAAAPEIEAQKSLKEILEAELSRKQTEAAKAKDGDREAKIREAQELARELATFQVNALPRLWADDCSPEKLASLLAEQRGRMAVLSPEGGIFEIMAGRYTTNASTAIANIEVYLKSHSGDAMRVDRIGRPPEYIPSPALTVGLAVQPDVIRGLAQKPGFRGRGLLARFLYAIPQSNIGERKIRPAPVPDYLRDAYSRNVRALLALPVSESIYALRLDQEAQGLMEDFCGWLEPQLPEPGELSSIQDWAAKLAGAVARLAGILHMAEYAKNPAPWNVQVSAQTMQAAITLGKYLIPHAQAAFAEMGADPELDAARYTWLRIMRDDRAATATQTLSKQDIWQLVKGRFKKVEPLDAALKILVDRGYLREIPPQDLRSKGRKPAPRYAVNPLALRPTNTRNTTNPDHASPATIEVGEL